MRSCVPPESRSSHESLSTPFPVTNVISHFGVRTFDMVGQMGVAEKVLVAVIVGTFVHSVIIVGAKVIFKTGRTIESLVTAGLGTLEGFQLGWVLVGACCRAKGYRRLKGGFSI
jgi:hypothetical protein